MRNDRTISQRGGFLIGWVQTFSFVLGASVATFGTCSMARPVPCPGRTSS